MLVVVCATAFCVLLQAQSPDDGQTLPGKHARTVPEPVAATPFSPDAKTLDIDKLIEFRTADQMTQGDRLLVANAESSIAEHAGLNGMAFEEGSWTYQQVACKALPNHLFLQYTRNNGAGDVTVFSASIPRDGEGRVRVIPILKRGYSLFSPAPINALTISAFNHIRAEEPEEVRNRGWLGNALCYAALAGGRPRVVPSNARPEIEKPIPAMSPMLDVEDKGGETIKFADAAATPRPMEWTMTFAKNGRLLKATHTVAAMYREKPVPKESPVRSEKPVPR